MKNDAPGTDSVEAVKRGEFDVDAFLNYLKWTLQTDYLEHDTLMEYGRRNGRDRLGQISFLIAQKAFDWCLEIEKTRSTTQPTPPQEAKGD